MSEVRSVRAPFDLLHPDLAAFAEAFPMPTMSDDVVVALRSQLVGSPAESDDVARTEHQVPGDPPLAVRVHRPVGFDGPLPCLFSMHGGGYLVGSRFMDDPRFTSLCPALGLVGVSIEYRLAPEATYPTPLEDCYRGLRWTFDHADELGIDRTRVGVGGGSAGGGLAAALALLAHDRGEVSIAFQLLESPMIDDRQITISSQLDDLPVWSRESNAYAWRAYLGERYGADDVPATAAPARATDLSGLPPAFVSVGSVDGFLDEDVDYALRLLHAGVPTELHVYPGAFHGFQMVQTCPITQQHDRDVQAWLARQI